MTYLHKIKQLMSINKTKNQQISAKKSIRILHSECLSKIANIL